MSFSIGSVDFTVKLTFWCHSQATLSEQDISTGDGGSELSFWKYLSTVHASNPCFINYNCSTFKDFSGVSLQKLNFAEFDSHSKMLLQ